MKTNLRAVARGPIVVASALAAGAVVSAFLFEDRDLGLVLLVWLSAAIPAFLLSYLRGLGNAAVTLSAGMLGLAALQANAAMSGGDLAEALPQPHVAMYVFVLAALVVMVELLHRERSGAEMTTLVDRVTGLPNRAYFDIAVQQEFASAERGRGMTLVMFDVDNLGTINKRFGRPSGDVVIGTLAKIVAGNTRKENLSAHFDTGRFATALREADGKGAEQFAQRVIDQFREISFPWGRATASAGIAEYEAGMGSHEMLIGAADRAVARAKAGGRDMVAFAPDKAEREEIARRAADAARGNAQPPVARKRLYLVDDDASVRSVVKGMLVRMGYEVWDTDDPALAITRHAGAAPDERPAAIVTDVIMPQMTGPRMVSKMVDAEPALRVLYISGYAQSEMTWQGAPGGRVEALAKPFSIEELTASIGRLLA